MDDLARRQNHRIQDPETDVAVNPQRLKCQAAHTLSSPAAASEDFGARGGAPKCLPVSRFIKNQVSGLAVQTARRGVGALAQQIRGPTGGCNMAGVCLPRPDIPGTSF